METDKAVAQSVAAGRNLYGVAQRPEFIMEKAKTFLPYQARTGAVRINPSGQGRADRDKTARARLALGFRYFDMAGDAENIFPCQSGDFLQSHSGQSA